MTRGSLYASPRFIDYMRYHLKRANYPAIYKHRYIHKETFASALIPFLFMLCLSYLFFFFP